MHIFAEVVIEMSKGFEMGLTEVDVSNRPGQPNVIVEKTQNCSGPVINLAPDLKNAAKLLKWLSKYA